MQLDRTNVVVRARSIAEIADLAMILIRAYPKSIILAFAVGALPWLLMNWLLLGNLVFSEFETFDYSIEDGELSGLWMYQWAMLVLVFLQTPIAGVLTTTAIGRSVFETQPTLSAAWKDARTHFWRWFWVLGVLRGPIPAMMIVAMFWGSDSAGLELFLLLMLFGIYGLIRAIRPFLPEMLLLERCPLRAGKQQESLTVSKRAQSLHRPIVGDCFSRFIVTALIAIIIAGAAFSSIMWFRGVLFNRWNWDRDVYLVYYPLSLWLAAGFTVVIRFLSYLDARIRLEGWEVQLAVMAEAIRQFGSVELNPVASRSAVVSSSATTSRLKKTSLSSDTVAPDAAVGQDAKSVELVPQAAKS